MFIAFGVFFAGLGSQYTLGSAASIGAGYFPTVLGCILMVLGIIVAVCGLSPKAAEDKVGRFAWSTLLFILGPIVLFGLLLNTLGLVLCLLMLIGISSYASHEFAWKAFFAGCVGTLLLAAFAVPLAQVAFKFGPAEYFSLMVLGMIGAVVLASGSLPKAIAMICLGLLVGMVLGFVLRPMMEENFRRSLLLSRGDFSVFFTRPLSLALLIATAALIVIVALPSIKSKREEAFQEE